MINLNFKRNKELSTSRVVITGMGTIIAGAENVNHAWRNIIKKKHNFTYANFKGVNARFFSFLEEAGGRYSLLPRSLTHVLPEHGKLALESCRQAIVQAFGEKSSPVDYYNAFDCGVLLGSGWGAFDINSQCSLQYNQSGLTHPKSNLITMPGSMTAACAIMYGLRGYQNTISAACATGSMAIGEAFELIRSGRAKCMVAGGAESLKSTLSIWSIDVLKALSKETNDPDRASCPFSSDRTGFVLAEGAAVVYL
jgi:3-oxoacyl-[acyl-carrier-protein] synthase II